MDPVQKYHPLPPNAPHLRLPYAVLDRLRLLKPGPRAVCEEIYRAAAGWHSDECVISIPKLAIYCRIDDKIVRKYIDHLVSLGYIERLDDVLGGSDIKARGARFRVLLPRMQTPPRNTPGRSTGGPEIPPNKDKIFKDNSKKVEAAPQDCPDCRGTGMWYPEGFEKGVAKCLHEKLTGGAESGG